MTKLSEEELGEWEKTRDLNDELLQAMQEMKNGKWVRKTEISLQADGSVHRVVTNYNGAVEKDHLISIPTPFQAKESRGLYP